MCNFLEAHAGWLRQIYLASRNASASKDVLIADFTMNRPEKTDNLIENAALRIVCGRRYGLAGRNGVGCRRQRPMTRGGKKKRGGGRGGAN